jgi:Zn-dependent metalloprotease
MKNALVIGGAAVLVAGLAVCATNAATAAPTSHPVSTADAIARAQASLDQHKVAILAATDDSYSVTRVIADGNGASHVRFSRTYRGLTVLGGDFVVHNAPDGSYAGAAAAQAAPLSLDTVPVIKVADAVSAARKAFTGTVAGVGSANLLVDASGTAARLAYETVVSGMRPDGQTPSKLHVLIDARSGAAISSYDEIETVAGTGNSLYSGSVGVDTTLSGGTYQLRDPSHGNGYTCDMNNGTGTTCTVFTDADNTWGTGSTSSRQSAAIDAHFGAAKTYDYFRNTFGRNGIFGDGAGVPSRVHYGNAYVNAFWDGTQMTYGDGSGNARPLVALDVAGHEMSHGVSEALANLTYSGESGGINEATSDIFGTMVEFYADAPNDPGDYQIGEKIDINGNGSPLRYLYNPALDGGSDSCWSSSTGGKNVHYSSGVGNHFFFLLAEGSGATAYGTSPVCGASPAVTGIGRTTAAAIWYHALDAYFTSSTKYRDAAAANNDARNYTLKAAIDLYGNCSAQYKAVQAAWTGVNVAGEDATCGGTPSPTPTPTPTPTPGTCAAVTNSTPVAIPDAGAAVTSPVTVSGCDRNASATTKVEVHITHTYRGDLLIDLVAPDGSSYRLKNSSGSDSADNVNATYTVNAGSEAANGVWKVRVQDVFAVDSGTLASWTLTV